MTPAAGNEWDVVVVGGGAAGFFAAATCGEAAQRSLSVLILEKGQRPLAKVLISGGGRCNLTHACFDPAQLVTHYPRGGAALRSAFTRFQPRDTLAWFERRGVPLHTFPDGCVFPKSDSSQSVVDCLMEAAREGGASLWTQARVISVESLPPGNAGDCGFRLHLAGGAPPVTARRVLLTTGGERGGFSLAAGLGHTIVHPVPSLFTFNVSDARLHDLAGVVLPAASVRLEALPGAPKPPPAAQSGPLLVTHWGLSGPAVLRLSAWGARWLHENNYQAGLVVNWLHPLSLDEALAALNRHKSAPAHRRQSPIAHPAFPQVPVRLWKRLVEAAGVPSAQNWADLSGATLRRLAEELAAGRYAIHGKGPFKEEFVTCGGVALDEVNFKTMESRRVAGLYLAGEVLDVDGLTGGFNLQNAWTTGWLAGRALAGGG